MSREGTATSMAQRVVDALEPVLAPYRFGPGSVHERDHALWSIMFNAPYHGVADRFPGSPYEPGEVADDEQADLYVLGSADDGLLAVEFEGAPLTELLRDAGLTLDANRLDAAMELDLDHSLDALVGAIRAFFS